MGYQTVFLSEAQRRGGRRFISFCSHYPNYIEWPFSNHWSSIYYRLKRNFSYLIYLFKSKLPIRKNLSFLDCSIYIFTLQLTIPSNYSYGRYLINLFFLLN